MGQVWTNDDSIGNELARLSNNFTGQNAANMAKTHEEVLALQRQRQTQADLARNFDAYQQTQKPTDLTTPLPPEWGGSIDLQVPTMQWTDPERVYNAERNLNQSQFALGVLNPAAWPTINKGVGGAVAGEKLMEQGLPTTPTGLATMQTQYKQEIPETTIKNNPLQDEASMRIEMARQQQLLNAGQTLSPSDIITGQQIAAKLIGAEKKEGVDNNMKPTIYNIPNAPPPGYEKWAATVGWGGSAAKDPTRTASPPSVGAGPSGPVVAGPAPAGPSAFSQGAPPMTQTPPPSVASAAPGASALPPAVTGPAGVPVATPPQAPGANAPPEQPIVPPVNRGGITATSYGNANPKDLRTEYEGRPAVKQYLISYDAAQAAMAALKSGSPEADKVAVAKLEQAVQASASAGGSQFTPRNQNAEGIGALVRDAKIALVGEGQLSDQQRRSIANETIKQAQVAYDRAAQETERFRVMARNGGLPNPDVVAPALPPPPKYDAARIAKPGTHIAPGARRTAPQSNLSDVDAIVGLGR